MRNKKIEFRVDQITIMIWIMEWFPPNDIAAQTDNNYVPFIHVFELFGEIANTTNRKHARRRTFICRRRTQDREHPLIVWCVKGKHRLTQLKYETTQDQSIYCDLSISHWRSRLRIGEIRNKLTTHFLVSFLNQKLQMKNSIAISSPPFAFLPQF